MSPSTPGSSNHSTERLVSLSAKTSSGCSTPLSVSQSLQDADAPGQLPRDPADSDESKLKQLLSVLKKAMGVKDMGSMRLSLPANLMAPIGNLEYWCYLDRPDVFAAMDDSEDELERMLAVLRWTLTKDSKFIHGPVLKPYNSVLGEQFRCIFDIAPAKVDPDTGELAVFETPSRSRSPSPGCQSTSIHRPASLVASSSSTNTEDNVLVESNRSMSTIATSISKPSGSARVAFLSEQVSHHPPISCYWYECRPKTAEGDDLTSSKPNVIAHGVDQIGAKFTGTSVKVFPGAMNKGIFVRLPNRQESYEITHPTATLTGLLRASPYILITDYTYITCRGPNSGRYRTMINYVDESWLGKARFALEGIVYEIQSPSDLDWNKLKHVPTDRICYKLSGSWRGQVMYTKPGGMEPQLLIDLSRLAPLPKTVRPEANQGESETRKFWKSLTELIIAKNYQEATRVKQNIEQEQRDLANRRKSFNEVFKPVFFDIEGPSYLDQGQPQMTEQGRKVLDSEFQGAGY